jgi:hypothetical protein
VNARRIPAWAIAVLAVAGLTALYFGAITAPFLNDDFLFLEEARSRGLAESLQRLGALGNYYRPLSRQIYFEVLAPVAGGQPLVFHLVNYAIFLAAIALLVDLLRALLPTPGVAAGALFFALLPLQRVNLIWVSCSQDLLAVAGVLGAVALHRRGRTRLALLPAAAAFASKEVSLPLPAALAAWEYWTARRTLPDALRRAMPAAVLAVAWAAVAIAMRERHAAAALLRFDLAHFAAGYAHLLQSLAGVEHPAGFFAAMAVTGPHPLPLVLLLPVTLLALRAPAAGAVTAGGTTLALAGPAPPATPAGPPLALAACWLAAFGLPAGPVSYIWSSYYYTAAAAGGAIAVGVAFRRAGPVSLMALLAGLLWLNAGGAAVRAFAVAERPWVWTSHLTSFYFERAGALGQTLSRDLERIEPDPPPATRLYFSNLPPFAGFQMGNGARIRALYRQDDLVSHFYSAFSESTAADRPCRFFFWNGEALVPLYANARDPFFQVGSDLLLLGRLPGAAHAFRRGLAAGESPADHLYWLGWTELWLLRRPAAERAWSAWGAGDDSLRWLAHLRAAHNAVVDGDSLEARRHLITAIRYGIGRREAHAALGALLLDEHPKYGLLELEVAARLEPRDLDVARARALGLASLRLDEPARGALASWRAALPDGAPPEAALDSLAKVLDARAVRAGDVVEF